MDSSEKAEISKEVSRAMAEWGRMGGHSRAANMSPEQRSEAARHAAQHPRPSRRKAAPSAGEAAPVS